MKCDDCPYLIVEEPNNKYWCDKIDGEVSESNNCYEEEGLIEMSRNPYRREHSLNSYKRDVKYKERMKKFAKLCKERWYSPVYPVNSDGHYVDDMDDMAYIKRVWRGNRSRYLKQQSNKKLRQYKGEIPDGGGYKKVFDFWWELY